MRTDDRRFAARLRGFTAIASACAVLIPGALLAQDAPPLPQAGDPPARVGRLAALRGAVSFRATDNDGWSQATPNYPVTSGSAVQVGQPGRAEVQVDADRFVVTGPGELDVTRLDDSVFAATLAAGETCFSLAPVPAGRGYAVQTPRGLVQIATGGRYAITAGDTAHPTQVIVMAGAAQVTAAGQTLPVAAGQAGSLTGPSADQAQGSVGPAAPDQCLTDLLAEEQAPARSSGPPPPPVVLQMTGGSELAGYGAWQPEPEYGTVWFPRVEAGWVPYRHGHWAFVAPWGWTWCDDAPWGFAPFHYGRWAQFGGRWGWTPGVVVSGPPVYAPALVTFFGLGVGASVGWVPLAPREPYYPSYRVSPNYVREINVNHVTNVTQVVNNYTSNTYSTVVVNHYANAGAATLVPAAAMARSQPVARLVQPVAPQQLAAARPVVGRLAQTAAPGQAPAAAAFRLPTPEHTAPAAQPVPRAGAVPPLAGRPLAQPVPAAPPAAARVEPHNGPVPAAIRPVEPGRPLVQPAPAAPPSATRAEPHNGPVPAAIRPVEPGRPLVQPVPAAPPSAARVEPHNGPVPAAIRPVEPVRPLAPPVPTPPPSAAHTEQHTVPVPATARPVEPHAPVPHVEPVARPAVLPPPERRPEPAARGPEPLARAPEAHAAPQARPAPERRKLPDQP